MPDRIHIFQGIISETCIDWQLWEEMGLKRKAHKEGRGKVVSSRENIVKALGIGFDHSILCLYVKFTLILKTSKQRALEISHLLRALAHAEHLSLISSTKMMGHITSKSSFGRSNTILWLSLASVHTIHTGMCVSIYAPAHIHIHKIE